MTAWVDALLAAAGHCPLVGTRHQPHYVGTGSRICRGLPVDDVADGLPEAPADVFQHSCTPLSTEGCQGCAVEALVEADRVVAAPGERW